MVPSIYNISTREAEAGGSLPVQGQPGFHVRPCFTQSIQSSKLRRMEGIFAISSVFHCVTCDSTSCASVSGLQDGGAATAVSKDRPWGGCAESGAQVKRLGTVHPPRFQILRRLRTAAPPGPEACHTDLYIVAGCWQLGPKRHPGYQAV